MALSKSQILTKLKKNGIPCYPFGNTAFYVPAKQPQQIMQQIQGMFMVDGGKVDAKSKYSSIGAIVVGNYSIVSTPDRYTPTPPRNLPSGNDSVKNRLAFSLMVNDVLNNTIKPLDIVFDGGKKITVKGVTSIRFNGKGVADFTLFQGTKPIPMSVHRASGNYRHELSGRYLDLAYDALERATMDEVIDAEMNGDTMTLNAAIAFQADNRSIRELMFQDINGGLGIVGNFQPSDFKYDGRSHELNVNCARAYQSAVDLKSSDKPYFVITNSPTGKIGEIKGLQVELVPQNGLPKRMVMVNI